MRHPRKMMLLSVLMAFSCAIAQQTQPFILQKNWYSKQMVDVFEDLSKKKLQKVEEGWRNIEKKFGKEKEEIAIGKSTASELLYPVWQLSHCVLLNTKDGRAKLRNPLSTAYDPWHAYSVLKEIIRDWEGAAWANRFFDEKNLSFSLDGIKNSIEKNLIDTVRAVATEEAYDQLIDMVVNCREISTLKAEREQVAFKSTILTDGVAKCNEYLAKYIGQNRKHEEIVSLRRDSLAFALMDTTIADCQQYLKDYPKSIYRDEVERRLHRYEFNQLAHTSKACQAYLDKYPRSVYAKQVGEFKVQYAFDEMKAKNSIEAFRSFLAEYRDSQYAADHGMTNDAQQLLSQALARKFISYGSTLKDLKDYLKQDDGKYTDISAVRRYYYNLLYQPSSAFMNGCDGLTGRVTIMHSQNGEDIQEVMVFNKQGLLSQHTNSKSGLSYSYEYVFDNVHGYRLLEKTDNKRNRSVTYTTKYNADGALEEISGNDGTKICYSYNDNQLHKVSYLHNGKVEHTDYYDSKSLVEKSVRSGNTIVYEYNAYGDVVSMKKMRGSAILSTSTYEYKYPDGMPWQSMSQYNDGNYLLTKKRNYETSQTTEQKKSLSESKEQLSDNNRKNTSLDNKVFDVVEVMPCFPGGDVALMKFLAENIKYPVVAVDNGIQGCVICTFIVERDGSITDIKIVKSVDPSLDKEAVRVLRAMPRWKPGIQKGAPVRVKYTVPVTFRLKD